MNGTWYRYNGTEAEDGTSFAVTSNADTYNLLPSSAYLFTNFPAEKCQLVYKAADAGPGTLRYALSCAQPGDTIRFLYSVLSDTIQLLTALDIDKNVVIEGNADYPMVLSAAQSDRAIHVLPGVSCELSGLNLQGGSNTSGSCIFNEGILIANKIKCTKSGLINPVSLLYNASGATIEYRGQNQIE